MAIIDIGTQRLHNCWTLIWRIVYWCKIDISICFIIIDDILLQLTFEYLLNNKLYRFSDWFEIIRYVISYWFRLQCASLNQIVGALHRHFSATINGDVTYLFSKADVTSRSFIFKSRRRVHLSSKEKQSCTGIFKVKYFLYW
jgi:hypothetical protein